MKSKHIIDIIKKIYYFPSVKTPLGRWNIHNYKQTALKIKYANEDNCGTCGDYTITENQELDKLYIYMMGLESAPDKK